MRLSQNHSPKVRTDGPSGICLPVAHPDRLHHDNGTSYVLGTKLFDSAKDLSLVVFICKFLA